MVSFFVTRIHEREMRTKILRLLGHRHVHYQVKYEHYDKVGEILLSALEESLSGRCDEETRYAWSKFCKNIFEDMLCAYKQ
jgi:hemoglobin-like flavoprotein